ncbi:MAG: RNA polymerase sigma factor [Candidatus Paceibacteria bacterium]
MGHVHTHDLGNLSDEDLLAYSLTHPSAFSVLVERYQPVFLERARYFMRDHDEAEDVVQDAFVRIYRFAPRFRKSAGTFRAWAITVLMNTARTHYQRKAKGWERTATLAPEHYEMLAAPSQKDVVEAKDIIERAFEFVPDNVRQTLTLAFIDGLSYREIAEREGTTEGAVKTRVHRAKKILRNVIGDIDI